MSKKWYVDMTVKTIMKRLQRKQHESKSDRLTERETEGGPFVISSLLHYPRVCTHRGNTARRLLSEYFYIKASTCFINTDSRKYL